MILDPKKIEGVSHGSIFAYTCAQEGKQSLDGCVTLWGSGGGINRRLRR